MLKRFGGANATAVLVILLQAIVSMGSPQPRDDFEGLQVGISVQTKPRLGLRVVSLSAGQRYACAQDGSTARTGRGGGTSCGGRPPSSIREASRLGPSTCSASLLQQSGGQPRQEILVPRRLNLSAFGVVP